MKKLILITLGGLSLTVAIACGVGAQRLDLERQNRIYRLLQTRQQASFQTDFIKNARRENLYPSNRYVIRYGQYHYKNNNIGLWKRNRTQQPRVNTTNTRIWNNQRGSDYVIQYPQTTPVLKNIGSYRPLYEINGHYYLINQ